MNGRACLFKAVEIPRMVQKVLANPAEAHRLCAGLSNEPLLSKDCYRKTVSKRGFVGQESTAC